MKTYEFPETLVDKAALLVELSDQFMADARVSAEDVEEALKLTREVLVACPDRKKLDALGEAAFGELDAELGLLLFELLKKSDANPAELEALQWTLARQRSEAALGDSTARIETAFVLIDSDQKPRALSIIERVDDAALRVEDRVELAEALELAGAPDRAEQVLRGNLEEPWIEPADREFEKEALLGLFARAGRTADAEKLEADERKRARGRAAGPRGGVVRTES